MQVGQTPHLNMASVSQSPVVDIDQLIAGGINTLINASTSTCGVSLMCPSQAPHSSLAASLFEVPALPATETNLQDHWQIQMQAIAETGIARNYRHRRF